MVENDHEETHDVTKGGLAEEVWVLREFEGSWEVEENGEEGRRYAAC